MDDNLYGLVVVAVLGVAIAGIGGFAMWMAHAENMECLRIKAQHTQVKCDDNR